jgi:hypothetical protein
MTAPIPARPYRDRLPPEAEGWLHGGPVTTWNYFSKISPREIWDLHCNRILHEHVESKPGTRPRLWWRWEAREMRQRLGGVGTPLHECSAHAAAYEYGVPTYWKTSDDRYLPTGIPISASDPPIFESEATYLERLNLSLPGEQAGIRRIDWRPVQVRVRRKPSADPLLPDEWLVELYRCAGTD